jgi:uncharacterized membrane protein HdeD (DUF308 family)
MSPSKSMMTAGIVLIAGGILALLAPFAVSIAITLIVGVSFLLGGLLNGWAALYFSDGRFANAIFALLGLVLGISFLANPLGGLISLTVLVGLLFLVSGVVRLLLAWAGRDHPSFWLLLVSGAVSVLLGGLILSDVGGATAFLGILLGIELLFAGIGLVTLSRMTRP